MFQIPHLSSDAPFAAADSKLAELKTELVGDTKEREARSQAPPPVTENVRRQRALLGETSAPTPTVDELTQRIYDLRGAIEIQRGKVTEAECAAGRRIAEQVRPQYIALMQRGVKAVKLLAEFLTEEATFGDELFQAGIRPCGVLPRFTLPRIDAQTCEAWLENVAAAYSI